MPQFYQNIQQRLPTQTVEKLDLQHAKDLLIVKPREFVSMAEHFSVDYHINLLTSPPPPLTINRKDHCFNKKSAVLMPPDVFISCRYDLPTEDYFLVTISRNRFDDVLSSISPSLKINKTLNFPYSRSLFSCVQNLYSELEHSYPGHELMAQSKLTEFIILLAREGRLTGDYEKASGKNYNYIDRALEYMNSYFNADISLDDLCRELNLSRYHFIRIFKAHTGTTPHAYLMDLRLRKSLDYLRKNDYTLNEIAALCGFVSQTHFSQCFRNRFGTTPAHFRNKG